MMEWLSQFSTVLWLFLQGGSVGVGGVLVVWGMVLALRAFVQWLSRSRYGTEILSLTGAFVTGGLLWCVANLM